MEDVYKELIEIVGADYISGEAEEQYMYSRDPGTMEPARPDLVAMPASTEEVSDIMKMASARKVPVVPMGAGLVLSGLSRALKGGIVLDLKRLDRIIEVNEKSRYAVVEAGVSQGVLQAHLKKHHPGLKHSVPDAPPIATIGGNVLIHGSGHLSAMGGFHSEMLNGLEVVLPTGEVVKTGSCSTSPYWFSRSPLPDLSGLFLGFHGTTGIVTRLAIKLYPDMPLNDVDIFCTEDAEIVPDVISRISGVQVAEDLLAWMTPKPEWAAGFQMINVNYGARTKKELTMKRDLVAESVKKYIDERTGGFMPLPSDMKGRFLEAPQKTLAVFADVNKGGGFEYVGAIMPVELFPEAYRKGLAIAYKRGVTYSLGARVVGLGHCMMFFYAYAFNRADPADMKRAQEALEETNTEVLAMGGIPWKAEVPAQKQIMERMDPQSLGLVQRVRDLLDPQGIMNPGNWEQD